MGKKLAIFFFVFFVSLSSTGIVSAQSTSPSFISSNINPSFLDIVTNPIGALLGVVSGVFESATVNIMDIRLPEVYSYGHVPADIEAEFRSSDPKKNKIYDFPVANPQFSIVQIPIMGEGSNWSISAPAGVYIAWITTLSLANSLFLIGLIFIGLLVMLQVKVNQYALKIMIPRFLVAIILAQFSWLLCDFVIDFTTLFAWVMNSFLSMFDLGGAAGGAATVDKIIGENGLLQGVINGFQLCIVWGGIIPPAASGSGFLARIAPKIPSLIAGLLTIPELIQSIQADPASGITGAALQALIMISGLCQSLLPYMAPIVMVTLLGFLSSIMLYLAMVFIRMVLIYALVVISPMACIIFIFPDLKKTVEKWTSTFFSLLIVYPMMVLVFGICYMLGYSMAL